MTVVEMNEWIPMEQFELKRDNVTDALMGIVQAKLPTSALGHHGVLIRLMSANDDNKGMLMYTIALQRNRVITIRKSFQDAQDQRRETVQSEEVSNSYKWLNSETYTGIWFLIKYGYIGMFQ
jgi:Mg2+ and Co2+ transporter CorA